jgi:ubiquinone/menaquinone biosynthesis C-methylase UbiE
MLGAMAVYRDHVLPRVQDRLLGMGETREIRARVCAGLAGDVVEVGFGSGHNLPYLPAGVTGLWAVDPSEVGRRLSQARRERSPVPVVFSGTDGESLPFPDDRFDAALSTWTLCTIPDAVAALRELRRVLRRDARLHFVEHGLAPDRTVATWQHRATPLQRRLAGGCHLDRDIPALLGAGGFTVESMDTYYERSAPKVLGHIYEGIARA